jgi:hypothetical protein
MSKTASDLRERLFAAIDGVKDGTTSIEQAKTISELSQVVVNLAKVEVDYIRATDGSDSQFLAPVRELPNGITAITTHRIRG